MSLIVAEPCVRLGLRAGAVLFRNVTVSTSDDTLRSVIRYEAPIICSQLSTARAIRELPEVQAFYAILRQVGVNPRAESPSVERLLAFALKRGDLPAINNLVDAYNLVSLR